MATANPESLARVATRIREEIPRLDRAITTLRDLLDHVGAATDDPATIHWAGGLVHDFYTGLEKIFSEVSPDMNGVSHAPDAWHRSLLHTMTLDLPGFRPPVIRADLEPRLVELLKFRHLYRNLYSFDLRWTRVSELGRDAVSLWSDARRDLEAFAAALDAMARA